jgi:hypothetical protein
MTAMARTTKTTTKMSDDHKAALAKGRAEGLVVRRYLEAIAATKPKRGRKRTPATIDARLKAIAAQLDAADALTKLSLLQERKDLEAEKGSLATTTDVSGIEKEFVKVAASYADRKGIDYATWREMGVDAKVLKAAGVRRGA